MNPTPDKPNPTPATMPDPGPRRTLLARLALAGLATASVGGWWALHRPAPAGASAQAGDPLPSGFWQQQFDTPAGPALTLSQFQGKPLLLNFWASWCPPCVKEMPELDRFHQAFAAHGGQVLGLAIDSPTPVKAFLGKTAVGFPIGLAGMGGTELAAALGNTAGGLPFSVLLNSAGHIVQRKLGAMSFDELHAWAQDLA